MKDRKYTQTRESSENTSLTIDRSIRFQSAHQNLVKESVWKILWLNYGIKKGTAIPGSLWWYVLFGIELIPTTHEDMVEVARLLMEALPYHKYLTQVRGIDLN